MENVDDPADTGSQCPAVCSNLFWNRLSDVCGIERCEQLRNRGWGGADSHPFFAGYLATFAVVALRLRYHMPKPSIEKPGPWNAIVSTRDDFT